MMRYVLYESPAGHARMSQEISFLQECIDLMHLRLSAPRNRHKFTLA